MGTPSHIGYLKMKEGDVRRHRSRCAEYDKKKNVCMCVKSPYFTIHCGGASHCKFYCENTKNSGSKIIKKTVCSDGKETIYVIPMHIYKNNKCTKCGYSMYQDLIWIEYVNDVGTKVIKKLPTLTCKNCNRKHINQPVYESFMRNKVIDNINKVFIEYNEESNC